jgi:Flp pilus assembly protein TadD
VNDFRLAQVHYEMACEIEPVFANAYFNLALIQSINNDLAAAVDALSRYQELASNEDARNTDELMETLKRALAAKRPV